MGIGHGAECRTVAVSIPSDGIMLPDFRDGIAWSTAAILDTIKGCVVIMEIGHGAECRIVAVSIPSDGTMPPDFRDGMAWSTAAILDTIKGCVVIMRIGHGAECRTVAVSIPSDGTMPPDFRDGIAVTRPLAATVGVTFRLITGWPGAYRVLGSIMPFHTLDDQRINSTEMEISMVSTDRITECKDTREALAHTDPALLLIGTPLTARHMKRIRMENARKVSIPPKQVRQISRNGNQESDQTWVNLNAIKTKGKLIAGNVIVPATRTQYARIVVENPTRKK